MHEVSLICGRGKPQLRSGSASFGPEKWLICGWKEPNSNRKQASSRLDTSIILQFKLYGCCKFVTGRAGLLPALPPCVSPLQYLLLFKLVSGIIIKCGAFDNVLQPLLCPQT